MKQDQIDRIRAYCEKAAPGFQEMASACYDLRLLLQHVEQLRKERDELRVKCETIGKMLGHASGICLEDRVANLRGNHGTLFGIAKGLLLRAAHDATCNKNVTHPPGNYECTCSLKKISEVLTDIDAALHPTSKPA